MTPTPPRYPMALLGAMTLATVGGPFLIGSSLRGGASPSWPPDRPLEWAVVLGVSGLVALLMAACVSLSLVQHKLIARGRKPPGDPAEDRP